MLVPLAQHILLEQILRNIVAVVLIAALLCGSLVVVALGEHDNIAAGVGINDCGVAGLSVSALYPLGQSGLNGGTGKIGLLLDLGVGHYCLGRVCKRGTVAELREDLLCGSLGCCLCLVGRLVSVLILILGVLVLGELGSYEIVAVGELIVAVLDGIVLFGKLLGSVGLDIGDACLNLACEGLKLHYRACNGLVAAAAVVCGEEFADAAVVVFLSGAFDGLDSLVDLGIVVVRELDVMLLCISLEGCKLHKLGLGRVAEILIPGVVFLALFVQGAGLLVEGLGGVQLQEGGGVVAIGVHKADILHMIYIVALSHGEAALAGGNGRVADGNFGVLDCQRVKRSVQCAGVEVNCKCKEDDQGNAYDDPFGPLLFFLVGFLFRIDVLCIGAFAASGLPVFSFG